MPRTKAINRVGLADQVYDAIEQRILDLEYGPGERLNIDQIARELEVSSTPVRDALNRMGADGLVVFTPYVGFSVRPTPEPDEIEQSFAARSCLESFATGLAATRVTEQQVARLRDMANDIAGGRYSSFAEGFRPFTRANREFHREIVALSGNRFLLSAWESLNHDELVAFTLHERGIPDLELIAKEHERIVAALASGNRQAAQGAAQSHVDDGAKRILGHMSAQAAGRRRPRPPRS